MEPEKIPLSTLTKMGEGEIPMTEEGQKQIDELRKTLNLAGPSFAQMLDQVSPSLPAILPAQFAIPKPLNLSFAKPIGITQLGLAAASYTIRWGEIFAKAAEAMRPFMEQMAEVLKSHYALKNTAREVYETEKLYYEKKHGLIINKYDPFWRWLCRLIDDQIFDKENENFPLDYESMVVYFGWYCGTEMDRRDSFVEAGRAGNFLTSIVNNAKCIPSLPVTKLRFTDLFNDPDDLYKCIAILRDVTHRNRKPVVDDLGNWIGKRGSISILIAWVEVIQTRAKFREHVSDTRMAELLNDHFPNLTLDIDDASIWRKITDTRNKYHAEFLQMIK